LATAKEALLDKILAGLQHWASKSSYFAGRFQLISSTSSSASRNQKPKFNPDYEKN